MRIRRVRSSRQGSVVAVMGSVASAGPEWDSDDDTDGAGHVVTGATLKSSGAVTDFRACTRSRLRSICPMLNAFGRCPT